MAAGDKQRIDKWLFFARIAKSRSLAAKLVSLGRVRINREKAAQSADHVRVGDVLTVNLDRRIAVLRVARLGERRGPAPEAQSLYEDLSPQAQPSSRASPLDGAEPLRQAKLRGGFAEE